MDFQEEFNLAFGEKYKNISLKDVLIKQRTKTCVVTFLYPATDKELTSQQKQEITDWLSNTLSLEKMDLKVKFMRAFLEERLILNALQEFFENKYKILGSYLSKDKFHIDISNIDVGLKIDLSKKMIQFFEEHKIVAELQAYLNAAFLTEFSITLNEIEINDDVDIESVEIKTSYRPQRRYKVEIVKEVVGKNITPQPEYLSYIKAPKEAVIVAGFIKKIERKDYVAKKGQFEGQQRTFFVFEIEDEKNGKIECVHFVAKRNLQVVEALEEAMFVLLHGDVRLNQLGKLCLYVDKIALASTVEQDDDPDTLNLKTWEGPVVKTERLAALEQDNMFGKVEKYNQKIMGKTIVVFDLETTGLDPEIDQIIELGAVKIEDGNIVEKFSTFVKPTVPIPFEVVRLTGIDEQMVENAPPVELVIKEFYEWTKGATLSGHNIIGFDLKFVKREGGNVGLDFDNPVIDTLTEARQARLNTTVYKLGTIAKLLGISLEGAHRAWNDAYATAQVLLKLNELNRK